MNEPMDVHVELSLNARPHLLWRMVRWAVLPHIGHEIAVSGGLMATVTRVVWDPGHHLPTVYARFNMVQSSFTPNDVFEASRRRVIDQLVVEGWSVLVLERGSPEGA